MLIGQIDTYFFSYLNLVAILQVCLGKIHLIHIEFCRWENFFSYFTTYSTID